MPATRTRVHTGCPASSYICLEQEADTTILLDVLAGTGKSARRPLRTNAQRATPSHNPNPLPINGTSQLPPEQPEPANFEHCLDRLLLPPAVSNLCTADSSDFCLDQEVGLSNADLPKRVVLPELHEALGLESQKLEKRHCSRVL